MKIFVISLADAADRRRSMQKQLSALHLSFEWLEAVDARQWDDEITAPFIDETSLYKNVNHKPLKGSIGCHLSHIKAYEALLSSDEEACLILEDDAVISDELPQYLASLEGAMNHIDILFLCDRRVNRASIKIGNLSQNHGIYVKKFSNLGTTAYVINRQAARKLVTDHKAFGIEIDSLLNRWWRHGLSVATIKPDLVRDEDAATQIGYELSPLSRNIFQMLTKKLYDVRDSFLKRRHFNDYCQKMAQRWK